ncbi:hypothetical protein [Bacillus thuringiensis]|uniref:hypothetical protein n=1 Tax=Bacillus thuringiensis TaxID=1428 RepID=UPI003A87C709
MIYKNECPLALKTQVHVKFLNGDAMQKDAVKKYASQWELTGLFHFKFIFDDHPESEIQVFFNDKKVAQSCLGGCKCTLEGFSGTLTLSFNKDTPEANFRCDILHEFGHALGLVHEHQHPDCPVQWDIEAVYAHYAKLDWDRKKIDSNVIKKIEIPIDLYGLYTIYEYDKNSIMHYQVEDKLTIGDFSAPYNTELSRLDKLHWASYVQDIREDRRCRGITCGVLDN